MDDFGFFCSIGICMAIFLVFYELADLAMDLNHPVVTFLSHDLRRKAN